MKHFNFARLSKLIALVSLILFGFTDLYSQYSVQIGSGTNTNSTSTASPINIYYRSLHCQTVYTAAEMQAAGASSGSILAMGYYVEGAPIYALPNFTVKMKNTTASDPSIYDGTGLTQVYTNPSYNPLAGGFDMLTLPNPFLWDGTSNILVDVCFDQVSPTYNLSGQVRIFNQTNGFKYIRYDNSSQCGVPTTNTSSNKPQIQFTMSPVSDCDLAVTEWLTPSLSSVDLTAAEGVEIEIKNMGNLAQTGYTVAYSIDGGTTFVTEIVNQSIAPSATYTHTFTQTADFSTVGVYDCVAYVSLACDSISYNDQINVQLTNASTIISYPYFQNFDSVQFWQAGGTSSSWEMGTPAASVINSAYSGTNAWTTSLTGNYNSMEYSWVESPYFNFSSLSAPIIEFKMWYDTYDGFTDGAALQYTIDNGATWHHVGVEFGNLSSDPNGTNWYNEMSIQGLNYTGGWAGSTGGWITGKYKLYDVTGFGTNLANESSVKFRFLMGSNASSQKNGFAFDDVNIYQAPNNDAGISSIYSLNTICEGLNDVYVTVENYGANILTSVNIDWEVNGVLQTPLAYTTPIGVNELDTVFLGTYNFVAGTVYSVEAYTSLPSGVADENIYNDNTLITGLETAFAGTYTIGATGDYPTFADAINVVTTLGVCGPVVFNVLPGTYTEQVTIGDIVGASATNTITFTSSTGNAADAVLQFGASSSSNNWVFKLNAAKWVIIDNMTVKSVSSGNYGRVIDFDNFAENNTVSNSNIESVPVTSSYAACIYSETEANSYNTIANNHLLNGYYGIYFRGSSSAMELDNIITGNTIEGFHYYGIYSYYQNGITINNNTLMNSSASSSNYGIYAYHCDGPTTITNNHVNLNPSGTTYGIRAYYCNGTQTDPALIANNFVVQSQGTGTVYGMYVYYSNYVNIFYNSINITAGSSTGGRGMYFGSGSSGYGNIQALNNNVVNTGGGYAFEITSSAASSGYLSISDHNNLYTSGSNLCKVGTTNVPDLAQLQAMGSDSNSVSVLPVFTAFDDLHTFSPNLNNIGTPVAEVTTDIDGELRDASTPDIGADEFTPANDDAGITGFVGLDAVCPGVVDVVATVFNFGLLDISTVTIDWEINGVPQTAFVSNTLIPTGTSLDVVLGTYNFVSGVSYDLSAWTSLPNGNADPNNQNDTTSVYGMQTSVFGTYTIGATGDFANVDTAVNYISAHGICGPVILNIQSGTYTGQITLENINGLSATNTLTFQSVSGDSTDVIIQYGASATADNWVFKLNGMEYVTIKNLTLKSTATGSYGRVLVFEGSSNYNTIMNCVIQSVSVTSSYAACIYSNTSLDQFNTIMNNHLKNGYYGIYFRGASSSDLEEGNVFSNNIVEDYYYYGIYSYFQNAVTITGNTVSQSSAGSNTNYSMYLYYNDGPIVVTKNKIHDTAGMTFYGIRVYYCDADTAAPGLIANNFISSDGPTGTAYGLYVYYSNNQRIYHNSVNIVTGSSTSSYGAYFYVSSSNGSGYSLMNNTIANTAGGYAIYISEQVFLSSALTSSNNNLYVTGSNLAKLQSTPLATLTDWQNYYPNDVLSVDPAYTSSSNLHSGSPDLNNAGIPLAAVTDDIDGDLRDAATPDIGADEYTPATLDVGISALVSPTDISGYCYGSSEIFTVSLTNFGLDTVFLANTPVTVQAVLSGIAPNTYAPIVLSTGNLAPGESMDVLIDSNLDMSLTGDYTFDATTVVIGDGNAMNDAMLPVTISVVNLNNLPYTEDFETFIPGAPGTLNNGWTIDPLTGFRWQVDVSNTPSSNTGPNVDHTTGTSTGVFMYSEASSGTAGAKCYLYPPCGDLSGVELHFWYHMYGATIDSFAVQAMVNGVWTTFWGLQGQQQSAMTDPWLQAITGVPSNAQGVRFMVKRGTSYTGDVALDDVLFIEPLANEAAIDIVYSYGQLPLGVGDNHVVSAVVSNWGTTDQVNLPVTLNITGANTFTDVVTIPLLPSYGIDTIYFAPFTPANLGFDNVEVTIPADDNNTNNSGFYAQEVTTNTYNIADTTEASISLGYNTGEGLFLVKYYINGLKVISNVNAYITGSSTIGQTVYAVVLDSAGTILSTSDNYILTAADTGTYVNFPILMTGQTTTANADLFVGIAQVAGSTGYYPLGVQEEDPARAGSYYTADLTGSPSENNSFGRFMIGATISDPDPFDASCIAISSPIGGCGLTTNEAITIQIQNMGSDTINGGVNASYQVDSNSVVTESVSAIIAPGAIYDYTFTQTADLFAPMDTAFNIVAWVDLPLDSAQYNDTTMYEVESLYVPVAPVATGATVSYGNQALLTAVSADSLFWFDIDTLGANSIGTGNSYLTPPLFDTTTYWVQAGSPLTDPIAFTTQWNNNNGQDGNMIDVTALNSDITIESFDVNIDNATTMEVWYKEGSFIGFETNASAWTLLGSTTISSNGVDVPSPLPIGGLTIPAGQTYGLYITTTSGGINYYTLSAPPYITDGELLIDNSVGKSYPFGSTFSPRLWLGTIYYTMGSGCASDLVPVEAIVTGIPAIDAGILYENSPSSGIELTMEPVSVDVKNWGSDTISNINITYEIDNGVQVNEIINATILPGDVLTYNFNTYADLTTFGIYNFTVYTSLLGDAYSPNDTITFQVTNEPLVYCSSGANSPGYEEIIQFTVSDLDNFSGPAFGSMYQDFTGIAPAVLMPGITYPITVVTDFPPGYSYPYNCWVEVYIDFDHSGTFDEPSEVFMSMATNSSNTVTSSFTVPNTALPGTHGMRVVFREGGTALSTTPCGYYSWGETEDYSVFVPTPIPHDGGVSEILSPSGSLLENTLEPVEVVVTNFGTDTIFNMDVVYTVDGINPVVYNYSGALANLESDTVTFPSMNIPGGYFDLCSYTVLTGDTNYFNDTSCVQLYGDPQFELGILSLDAPVDGCDYGFEDVTIQFANNGDTLYGGITASYFTTGMAAQVDEVISDTIYPGDVYTYTFTTQIDLGVSIDTEFDIYAWINSPLDPVQQNDTINQIVVSGVSPASPFANDATIWSGEFTTLNIVNPDTNNIYYWYDSDTTQLFTDTFMVTPALFDTTTYYISAANGSGASLAITEISLGGPDFIEIQNMTNGVVDATGWVVAISASYSDINSVNTIYWNLGTLQANEVQYKTDSSSDNYWGNNILWNPGSSSNYKGWAMIVNDMGEVVDFISMGWDPAQLATFSANINGFTVDLTTAWDGPAVTNYTSDFLARTNYDSNTLTDWQNLTTNTKGVANPNMVISGTGSGCETQLVPVTVNVQYADYDGALANIVSPVTGSYLGLEPVTVDIYNNGLLDISNFPVSYTLNGAGLVTDTITAVITPGMTYTYTFSQNVDISTYASYDLCAFVGVPNDGYSPNDTLCTVVENMDGDGNSCASAFPYLMLNDPPVMGSTAFAYDLEWWRFVLPIDANNVVVSLCGSTYDTKLEVWNDCNAASYMQYNDDNFGCSSNTQSSEITFSFLSAGTYYAKVYGYSGSFGDYILEITGEQVPVMQVDLTGTMINCYGEATGSITSDVIGLPGSTPPYTYLWSNGETTPNISNLTAGIYELTVTDAGGLTQVESLEITQPSELIVSLAGTDPTILGAGDGAIDATITGGVTPYVYHWSNNAATEDITNAYAGVYTLTVTDANVCSTEAVDTLNTLPPPSGWEVTQTAVSHEIVIPQSAVILLDGSPLSPGSYVGVFYLNQTTQTLECGGWAYWSGMETSVIAYGSDAGQNNGFAPNEVFHWRVYDAALGVEFGGNATYLPSYPDAGNFVINGLSGINPLEAFSIVSQNVPCVSGWSIWSTYIDPVNPAIDDILDPITAPMFTPGPVEIVKSGSGLVYWPFYGLNTIVNVVIGEGYQIKINGPDTAFNVVGLIVPPELTPLTFNSGWSIIGYLRTSPAPIADMFAPITAPMFTTGPVEIVKSGNGLVYWPYYGLNTIINMIPGQGYQLKMNSTQTYTYPANTSSSAKSYDENYYPQNYTEIINTGNNMTLGIPEDAWNTKPENGDEIGVFDSNGKLIGSSVYRDDFTAITIWGNEILKDTESAKATIYSLKLWHNTTGIEEDIVVESWKQGNDQFETNAISIVKKLSLAGIGDDQFVLYQNMPNPFTGKTNISFYLPKDCHVQLAVYNLIGDLVEELVSDQYISGKHTIEFDASSLPSGNYFYKIVTDDFVATKVMNLNR